MEKSDNHYYDELIYNMYKKIGMNGIMLDSILTVSVIMNSILEKEPPKMVHMGIISLIAIGTGFSLKRSKKFVKIVSSKDKIKIKKR